MVNVYSKGFIRIQRKEKKYFRTKTTLIDPPLKNLGNFHVNESNDVITLYWIGLDQITLSEKYTTEIHGIGMYVIYRSKLFYLITFRILGIKLIPYHIWYIYRYIGIYRYMEFIK